MAVKKASAPRQRSKSKGRNVRSATHGRAVGAVRGSANQAEVAAKEAWTALAEAVRFGKTQPASAARATGKAVRNIARTGSRETRVAAETLARAAEVILISAMREATVAAKAAREAALELERSVSKALNEINYAVRKRAHAVIDSATLTRPPGPVKTAARKRPRVSRPGKRGAVK
jgi:hypothetical protein